MPLPLIPLALGVVARLGAGMAVRGAAGMAARGTVSGAGSGAASLGGTASRAIAGIESSTAMRAMNTANNVSQMLPSVHHQPANTAPQVPQQQVTGYPGYSGY